MCWLERSDVLLTPKERTEASAEGRVCNEVNPDCVEAREIEWFWLGDVDVVGQQRDPLGKIEPFREVDQLITDELT